MRTIVTISMFCIVSALFSQVNENNLKNNQNTPVPAVEEKLKSTTEAGESGEREESTVFNSNLQSRRYNYEFTRKRFNKANSAKGYSADQQKELDGLIGLLEQDGTESFEYNYLKYVNGNHNTDLFKYLEKAYQLKPYDANLYDDFIAYYEIVNNPTKKGEFTKKLMASNTIESGVYKYNENVLRSVDQNGILITNGYDDTYPIWVLQNEKGVRKDVKVLSLDLLQNKEYLKRILKSYNLKDPGVGPEKADFIAKLCQLNPDKNLFLGYTAPKNALKSLADVLKNTGLALKYAPKKLNEDKLKINFEKDLQLDYLLENQTSKKVKALNGNYLISLVQLYSKYEHDLKKQEYIKKIALKVARDINKEELIKESLGL